MTDVTNMLNALKQVSASTQIPMELCHLCGKMHLVSGRIKYHTGVFNVTLDICTSCAAEASVAKMVRMVCLKCKKFVGFMEPETHKSGFRFEPLGTYHMLQCPRCAPRDYRATVVELARHYKKLGIPMRVEHDIVQEAEQKGLQGIREGERVAAAISTALQ